VLFTRTIRRTMVCGLVIVLVTMILLSVSAIYSHFSYRQIIRELDYSFNKCPRKHELTWAIARLKAPLPKNPSRDPESVRKRQECFHDALKKAQVEANDYLFKLQCLPPRPEYAQKSFLALQMVRVISDELSRIEKEQLAPLDDPAHAAATAAWLRDEVDKLHESAVDIPDFQEGIPATLDKAFSLFQQNLRLVAWSGGLALVFFSGLIVYGYIWVFEPLRRLHQGALRVAQGDFN